REEYRPLESMLTSTLKEAMEQTQTTTSEEIVYRELRALDGSWPFSLLNAETKLHRLVNAIQYNLQMHLQNVTRAVAIAALQELEYYCAEAERDLDAILQRLRRQREANQGWAAALREVGADTGHPFHMAALSNPEEIKRYSDQ